MNSRNQQLPGTPDMKLLAEVLQIATAAGLKYTRAEFFDHKGKRAGIELIAGRQRIVVNLKKPRFGRNFVYGALNDNGRFETFSPDALANYFKDQMKLQARPIQSG